MPDRIIRERICESPTLAALSDASERPFARATTRCDDYGRFNADPEVLLARCFEKRPRGWTVEKMVKVLDEWEAVELIHRYETGNGHVYAHFVTFLNHQRERDSKPKFPDPPCGNLPQDAAKCRDSRQVAARARETVRPSAAERREPRGESMPSRPVAASGGNQPAVKRLIDSYYNKFLAQFGKKPVIHGAKDGAIFKRLLGSQSESDILACLDRFFAEDDAFTAKAGHTIGVFASRFNALLVGGRAPAVKAGIDQKWAGVPPGTVKL